MENGCHHEGDDANDVIDTMIITKIHKKVGDTNDHQRAASTRFKRRVKLQGGIMPEFSAPIGNVTAVLGRDVRLLCQVENLGQYQVAWLKEETKTILSIDTNIIITNYRIFLIPDEEEKKWALHIKDVQESDRGSYQCQLNTSPMRSISGYLEVVVPPSITASQTSQMAEVDERTNLTVQCCASGHPRPTISWRREDGTPIRLNGQHDVIGSDNVAHKQPEQTNVLKSNLNEIKSERLSLHDVDKSMAGVYVCTASNGIPVPVSKRVPIYVKYQPKVTVQGNFDSIQVGDQLQIDCLIEAFPKPNVYWTKRLLSSQATQLRVLSTTRQLASSKPRLEQAVTNRNQFQHQSNHAPISGPSIIRNRILTSPETSPSGDGDNNDNINGNTNETDATTPMTSAGHSTTTTSQVPSAIRSPISVKHSTIDSQTYKLTMTINKLKESDFGEYSCIAINSNGQSDASVVIDSNSKIPINWSSRLKGHIIPADVTMQASPDQQIDVLAFQQHQHNHKQQLQLDSARQRSPGHRIYDEKYLEAIKARQSGNNSPMTSQAYQLGKSQQKLHKLKGFDRNASARSARVGAHELQMFGLILAIGVAGTLMI